MLYLYDNQLTSIASICSNRLLTHLYIQNNRSGGAYSSQNACEQLANQYCCNQAGCPDREARQAGSNSLILQD